jgi:hypothetical protein
MTNDQIDTAIAEYVGWTEIHSPVQSGRLFGVRPNSENQDYRVQAIPQFHCCLNACHEMEKSLSNDWDQWTDYLEGINCEPDAPATWRCESFLRTIGKWQEPDKLSTHIAV